MAICYFIIKEKGRYESFVVTTNGDQPLLDTIKLKEGEDLVYKGALNGSATNKRVTGIIREVVADANKNGSFDAATLERKIQEAQK